MRLRALLVAPLLCLPSRLEPPPSFTAVQPSLLRLGTSFTNAVADYDGDGDLDLFVGFGGVANRLYRNDRGTLVDVGAAAGVAVARAVRSAAWADVDADGDPDLLVGYAPGPGSILTLFRNDAGRFTDVTDSTGLTVPTGGVRHGRRPQSARSRGQVCAPSSLPRPCSPASLKTRPLAAPGR